MKQIISQKNRSLLLELVRTDFKLRYQASILGYLWSVMKPLFMFSILYTVFGVVLKLGAGIPNYALSLLLGIVLWNFFAEATSGALKSVVSKGSLIRKIDIPRYLIPVASVSSAFINMVLNLIVVFVFIAFGSNLALSGWTLIILPLLIVELILFTTAVSFFLSAVFVKFRDIDHIWDVVRQALFYSIPIIYPLSRIPYDTIQQIVLMNPLVQIIQDARSITTHAGTPTIPDLYASDFVRVVPIAIVVLCLFVGARYFSKRAKYFAEQV